jgi:hypothetical protein
MEPDVVGSGRQEVVLQGHLEGRAEASWAVALGTTHPNHTVKCPKRDKFW